MVLDGEIEYRGRAAVAIEPVSVDHLCKTGISAEMAGTFGNCAPRLGDREQGVKVEYEKPGYPACEAQVANCRQTQDWLAGDAVLVAPVSGPNSLQTGNFAGNARDFENPLSKFAARIGLPHRFFAQFPGNLIREKHFEDQEISSGNKRETLPLIALLT